MTLIPPGTGPGTWWVGTREMLNGLMDGQDGFRVVLEAEKGQDKAPKAPSWEGRVQEVCEKSLQEQQQRAKLEWREGVVDLQSHHNEDLFGYHWGFWS